MPPPAAQTNRPAQSPAQDVAQSAARTADAILQTALNARLPDAPLAAIDLARTAVNASSNVTKLDKAMQDLSVAAPGTTTAIQEVSTLMTKVLAFVPPANLPAGPQALVTKMQTAATSFETFVTDYRAYENAPAYSLFSPSTWGVKTAAGATALGSWRSFKTDYDAFTTEFQRQVPVAADPAVQGAAVRALNQGLNTLERLLK